MTKEDRYEMAKGFIVTCLCCLMAFGSMAAIKFVRDRPTAFYECVKVVNADGTEGSCDQLPTRHERVWVQ